MSKYLLDTNILIDMGRGVRGIREKIESVGPSNCMISEVSIAKLQVGCELTGNVHEKMTLGFCKNNFRSLPVSEQVLDTFARLKAKQIKIGKKVPDFDLLIASTALVNGLTVVSADTKHFPLIQDIVLNVW